MSRKYPKVLIICLANNNLKPHFTIFTFQMRARVANLFFYLLLCPTLHASSSQHPSTLTSSSNASLQSSVSTFLNSDNTFQPSSKSYPNSKSQPSIHTAPYTSATQVPNTVSTSPSLPSSKCCPPNYILSSAMSCIPTKGKEIISETFEYFVLRHPGLANCIRELEAVEITEDWNYSRTNEDPLNYCVENVSLISGDA